MSELADDLRAAKALIDTPEKWLQHDWGGPKDGGYCSLGAIGTATHADAGNPRYDAAKLALSFAITRDPLTPLKSAFDIIVRYNDARATTHADIMAAFDRAIEAAS